jgi:23S rRNA G2445 N2-methylase RlmL
MATFRYYAHTLPGFGSIAQQEIASKLSAKSTGIRTVGNQNDVVLFEYGGDPQRLLEMRSTEDVFFLVQHLRKVPSDRRGLAYLRKGIRSARYFDVGLRIHKRLCNVNTKRQTTFRVISRRRGHHAYRRIDAQRAIEKGVLQRYNYSWRLVPEGEMIEIWVNLLGTEAIVGLRLSDATMRHRHYKTKHLPASLRPSAAFALAFLSDPEPGDVFLDPMCGAGTILIERALAGRYRLLIGADTDPVAIAAARRNIGPKYKPLGIGQWDAAHSALKAGTIDKIVTNLPFGRQIGSHAENVVLYGEFFTEAQRVLKTGGRMVLLSSERRLIQENLACYPEFDLQERYKVSILGTRALIYEIDRR